MNTYELTVTVNANTREEAESKLQLILQMGAFVSDFDATSLGIAYLKYRAMKYLGQTAPPSKKS